MNFDRRQFLSTSLLAASASLVPGGLGAQSAGLNLNPIDAERMKFSLKIGMCAFGETPMEKFRVVKDIGYDGIELNSPGGLDKQACLEASQKLGLPIHGVVNSIHWQSHFSSPDPEVQATAIEGLRQCIRDTKLTGGSAVLIVPGVVNKENSHQQVWDRSIETISKVIPFAAFHGIHILIENVWNNFLYDPSGSDDQSADLLKNYIDEFNSPWIGSYFDIGNIQKFGKPEKWITTLGSRIVKLDVKDWSVKDGFCSIGAGDVNWPEVRKSLLDINYTGWATAEVAGGDKKRCTQILANMKSVLLGV